MEINRISATKSDRPSHHNHHHNHHHHRHHNNQNNGASNKSKKGARKTSINVLTIKKEEIISLAGGQPLAGQQQLNTPEPDMDMQCLPKQTPNPSLIKRKSKKAYLNKQQSSFDSRKSATRQSQDKRISVISKEHIRFNTSTNAVKDQNISQQRATMGSHDNTPLHSVSYITKRRSTEISLQKSE